MKYYIRTTHNFNNETREWEYRVVVGDMHFHWKNHEKSQSSFTLGVHALKRDEWLTIEQILTETITANLTGALDYSLEQKFLLFIKNNDNFGEILKQDIQKELDELVKIDMVRVKEVS